MKQLSIRLVAPFGPAFSIAARLLAFVSRSAGTVVQTPRRLVGKWRLYLNYCPECKSCAPKLHQCDVCRSDTKAYFNWTKDVAQTWWNRYAEKHRFSA